MISWFRNLLTSGQRQHMNEVNSLRRRFWPRNSCEIRCEHRPVYPRLNTRDELQRKGLGLEEGLTHISLQLQLSQTSVGGQHGGHSTLHQTEWVLSLPVRIIIMIGSVQLHKQADGLKSCRRYWYVDKLTKYCYIMMSYRLNLSNGLCYDSVLYTVLNWG